MSIFISYSSKSRAIVETLAMDLDALGYSVWFDSKLTGGQDWWSEILNSIKKCNLFLFALTQEAIESHPCRLEYDYASSLNKRVLPVMLSDINIGALPSSLQKLQIIDYRQQNKQQALSLSRALISLPSSKPLPKPLPPKPEMPVPPLTKLRDQIDSTTLKPDEQRLIVSKLKEFLGNAETAGDARMLLRRLREREDLLAKIERDIAGLLDVKKKPKNTAVRPTSTEPLVLQGHSEAVFSVAFSPDGRTLLTGSVDNTVRLWDVLTGSELCRFVGHTGSVWNVAFSPNGKTMVSSSRDKTVRLWDIASGKELMQFIGHTDSVWGVAYSPDGHTILTGSFDKTARLWEVKTGKELRQFTGHTAAVWGVSCAPDGRTILTGSWDKTVKMWNIETGTMLREFLGHTTPIVNVAYSPDGHTILTSDRDTVARLWDTKSGLEIRQFVGHVAFGVAYAPDARTVLTGGRDKTARLWSVKTGKELAQFVGHEDAVTSVTYSPDNTMVLTGSADKTARLWEIS